MNKNFREILLTPLVMVCSWCGYIHTADGRPSHHIYRLIGGLGTRYEARGTGDGGFIETYDLPGILQFVAQAAG